MMDDTSAHAYRMINKKFPVLTSQVYVDLSANNGK